MEKQGPSSLAGGTVKWCSCFGAQCDSSSRGEHTATV
jgi:hypothetical protein